MPTPIAPLTLAEETIYYTKSAVSRFILRKMRIANRPLTNAEVHTALQNPFTLRFARAVTNMPNGSANYLRSK